MQLHRTNKKPDWELTSNTDWNRWQRIASASRGTITPGNVFTIGGFLIVIYGLMEIYWQRYWLGIAIIFIGRLCDIADGWLAERTGTKSPLGEALDAGFDKTAVVIGVIILGSAHTAPWWLLIALLLPHLLMSLVTVVTFSFSHHVIHPSRSGKNSMAASWICLGALPILQALHWQGTTRNIVYGLALASVIVYFVTVIQYMLAELNRR